MTKEIATPDQDIPWSSVPVGQRLAHLKGMVVDRDIERQIHDVFDVVREARMAANEPANVVVIGETGVGKSDILKRYLAKNPSYRLPDKRLKRPVFLIEIRNQSTPRSVARQMLRQLGLTERRFLVGAIPDLTALVKHQLIIQQVELCILDEFNNTLSDDGRVRSSRVAEWVKDLCKSKTRTDEEPDGLPGEIIPFAMVGTAKTGRIVDPIENEELASLTPYRFQVERYPYDTEDQVSEFRRFLDDLDQELPFDEFSHLGAADDQGRYDLADKIHVATYGLLRQVGYLVREAARLAIVGGDDRIREHHLHRSVENQRGLLQSNLLSEDGKAEKRSVTNPFKAPLAPSRPERGSKRGFQKAA
ncbi:AAA family ATPase [Sphingomonas sp. A2-49]|uniref:AAA family ATPase n=1 Tax=Sphingomonas sp. A2-49 TaxID=1391375 RepID=UPI0021D286F9|nr:AAA family ATPase [Sphingomonas sp. A2-49]MCU6455435.1 AAA family ATPase [Sphingomonas sp. A2-49]